MAWRAPAAGERKREAPEEDFNERVAKGWGRSCQAKMCRRYTAFALADLRYADSRSLYQIDISSTTQVPQAPKQYPELGAGRPQSAPVLRPVGSAPTLRKWQ